MRDQSSGDDKEHPRKGHSGKTHSTQKGFSHLCVHGSYSHRGKSDGNQPLSVTLEAVLLQEIHEAVKQAYDRGQQEEQKEETDRPHTFLQAPAEKHQSCDVQKKLSKGSVVKGKHQDAV